MKALKARWSTPEGAELSAQVLLALQQGDSLPASIGTWNGRVDLRGIDLTWGRGAQSFATIGNFDITQNSNPRPRIADSTLADLDFSHATLSHLSFAGVSIKNCIFDAVKLTSVSFMYSRVTESSFLRARLTSCLMAVSVVDQLHAPMRGGPTTFENCDFTGSKLLDCQWSPIELYDCKFEDIHLRNARFDCPIIERTTFSGRLRDVEFQGHLGWTDRNGLSVVRPGDTRLVDVDFTDAYFDDVSFRDVRQDHVRWPRNHQFLTLRGNIAEFLEFATTQMEAEDELMRDLALLSLKEIQEISRVNQDSLSVQLDIFDKNDPDYTYGRASADLLVKLAQQSPSVEIEGQF